jgi:hypothetical protein
MAILEIAKIQVRRGQELITGMPNLDPGEFGWAEDTQNLYIGKRISEGADSDAPTRILVEKDLENIFKRIASVDTTSTVNSLYTYRKENEFLTYNTNTTIQRKLDSLNPTIYDFGVANTVTTVDITLELQRAVRDLYRNENLGTDWLAAESRDLRRQLILPPGTFLVSSTVELPPYASIVGSGPDKTKIIFNNSITNLFQTIDLVGNDYESGEMQSGSIRSKEIYIGNMTLEFSTTTNSNNSLISLDNVLNAKVENCVLKSSIENLFENASTSSYTLKSSNTVTIYTVNSSTNYFTGQQLIAYHNQDNFLRGTVVSYTPGTKELVLDSPAATNQFGTLNTSSWIIKLDEYLPAYVSAIHGTGIQVRGAGGGISGDVNLCENIVIKDCTFDGIKTGVQGIGSVVRIVAENNLFNNLDRGVTLESPDLVVPAPSYARVVNNRFQNIIREGFFVDLNADNKPTYHVSEGNYYVQVGNGTDLDDLVTAASSCTSVIAFRSNGNKSINDYFSRRTMANETTDPSFYYHPIVTENALVKDESITVKAVNSGTTTSATKFYLTNKDQKIDINYQISGNGLSRKGSLLINVAPDGYTSFSDYYNYSQTVQTVDAPFTVTTALSTTSFSIVKTPENAYIDSVNISGNWYVVGSTDPDIGGVVTYITATLTTYEITVDPAPTINFYTSGTIYDFAFSDFLQPTFYINTASIGTLTNYASLEMINPSAFEMSLEYRIDQQT